MNANDFDLDFDFEKEYGFDLPKDEESAPAPEADEDFDLRALLESNFNEEADLFDSEYENNFDYGPETEADYGSEPDADLGSEPEQEVEPEVPEFSPAESDFLPDEESQLELSEEDIPAPAIDEEAEAVPTEEEKPAPRQRRTRERRKTSADTPRVGPDGKPRKPLSPMRRFKNETLPLIIAGAAALLIVVFVFGAIGRAIGSNLGKNNSKEESTGMNAAQLEKQKVDDLLEEAAALATGYNYQGAIDLLNSFEGDRAKYTEIDATISSYKQAQSQLVAHNDPGEVVNLSFHVLIADPSRAFSNQEYGKAYNMNFVTTDEFEAILEQLYANNFVLVSMDDFIAETSTGDTITYDSKTLYLPDGKKPVMITETLVNYFNYMIDGNGDGTPDAQGAGFASRLVVDANGEVKAEMVDANGQTITGNYDLVPILEDFIKAHPDFSYQGARATLAVTGHEGVFGYRINKDVINSKGQEYYDEQVAGAKAVVDALRAGGYEIACFTYGNKDYGDLSATAIQEDINKWTSEIVPVIGQVDTLVYARATDIAAAGAYSGNKYNVLKAAGFRYFIGKGSKASASVYDEYVRQNRVMVTGTQMAYAATMYSNYFDAKSVLNSQRGNVPQ